ncbi:hypothetical protein BKA61DRAFT_232094 [Leptodontidium sp. MPI-SDFR-AT-0119]|nr:hypothetical protein BKA61DRAFT_232094 [Leptodontidium sp. MPI-SDFR-AT-0119]
MVGTSSLCMFTIYIFALGARRLVNLASRVFSRKQDEFLKTSSGAWRSDLPLVWFWFGIWHWWSGVGCQQVQVRPVYKNATSFLIGSPCDFTLAVTFYFGICWLITLAFEVTSFYASDLI